MKKKCVVLLLAVVCLFSAVGVRGYAAEPRASAQIASYGAGISWSSDGRLEIRFTIQGTSANMYALGASSVVVQRLSGSNWVSEYTFNIRDYPKLQASNTNYHALVIGYSPRYSGAKYRAMVFFYARNSAGTDTAIKTTNAV